MSILLVLIPLLAVVVATILYHHNGKRQLLNLDIVQFIYAFVMVPVLFIWLKSFLYFIVRSELGITLSFNEFFVIDTAFSLVFIYISFFVVLHAVGKSFDLQREKDPLVDLFELSEYFHHTLSHTVIFVGSLALTTMLSIVNILSPITAFTSQNPFWIGLFFGAAAGIIFHIGVLQYDTASRQFLRLMKLVYAIMFLIHVSIYFIVDPPFIAAYGFYWTMFAASATLVVMGIFAEPKDEDAQWWKPFTLNPKRWVSIVNSIKYVIAFVRK